MSITRLLFNVWESPVVLRSASLTVRIRLGDLKLESRTLHPESRALELNYRMLEINSATPELISVRKDIDYKY